MPTTYAQIKQALDEIAQRINTNRGTLDAAATQIASAEAQLAGMPAQYGSLLADLDAALVADPDNEALATAVAEKELLVAEFTALQAEATAMKDALAAVEI